MTGSLAGLALVGQLTAIMRRSTTHCLPFLPQNPSLPVRVTPEPSEFPSSGIMEEEQGVACSFSSARQFSLAVRPYTCRRMRLSTGGRREDATSRQLARSAQSRPERGDSGGWVPRKGGLRWGKGRGGPKGKGIFSTILAVFFFSR